jgi:hypothetical protein
MRKTLLPREFAWKDAEVLKGIFQLERDSTIPSGATRPFQ